MWANPDGGARRNRAPGSLGLVDRRQGSLLFWLRVAVLVLGVMVLVPSAQAAAAPTVTIDDVSDTILGSADTGTDVTWHADEVGTYSVRVGIPGWPPPESTNCTTGLEVEAASISMPPRSTPRA